MRGIIALTFVLISQAAFASNFPRVDADIRVYDEHVLDMTNAFAKIPSAPADKDWVKLKLQNMVDVDQYMRRYANVVYDHQYSEDEASEFRSQFSIRFSNLDQANTADLKDLLKLYRWFTISQFGEAADSNAWLLVQHADLDPEFQKKVLIVLESLLSMNETKPSNFAYLLDRVAASWYDPTKRTLQRYGTQGICTGPGKWEPIPVEDPENLDQRRQSVGLESEADYILRFKDICR